MRKYMVVINDEYIVKVEALSYYEAEQSILDRYKLCNKAQAFEIDTNETRSDEFMYNLLKCSLLSTLELKRKDIAYTINAKEWLNEQLDLMRELEHQLLRLEYDVTTLQKDIHAKENRMIELIKAATEHADNHSISYDRTSDEDMLILKGSLSQLIVEYTDSVAGIKSSSIW